MGNNFTRVILIHVKNLDAEPGVYFSYNEFNDDFEYVWAIVGEGGLNPRYEPGVKDKTA